MDEILFPPVTVTFLASPTQSIRTETVAHCRNWKSEILCGKRTKKLSDVIYIFSRTKELNFVTSRSRGYWFIQNNCLGLKIAISIWNSRCLFFFLTLLLNRLIKYKTVIKRNSSRPLNVPNIYFLFGKFGSSVRKPWRHVFSIVAILEAGKNANAQVTSHTGC